MSEDIKLIDNQLNFSLSDGSRGFLSGYCIYHNQIIDGKPYYYFELGNDLSKTIVLSEDVVAISFEVIVYEVEKGNFKDLTMTVSGGSKKINQNETIKFSDRGNLPDGRKMGTFYFDLINFSKGSYSLLLSTEKENIIIYSECVYNGKIESVLMNPNFVVIKDKPTVIKIY